MGRKRHEASGAALAWEKMAVAAGSLTMDVLGYVVCATEREGRMPYETYIEWCEELGIPEAERVDKPKLAIVFHEALNQLNNEPLTRSQADQVRVKRSIKTSSRNEYFAVEEVFRLKPDGSKVFELSHKRAFHIYLRTACVVVLPMDKGTTEAESAEFYRTLKKEMDELELSMISSWLVGKVRTILKQDYGGIPYTGATGGQYFVRATVKSELDKHIKLLERFAQRCNSFDRYKTQLRVLPVIDTTDQRQQIAQDVSRELETRMRDISLDLTDALSAYAKGDMSKLGHLEKLLATRQRAREQVAEIRQKYSRLLGVDVPAPELAQASQVSITTEVKGRFASIVESCQEDDKAKAEELGRRAEAILFGTMASPDTARFASIQAEKA